MSWFAYPTPKKEEKPGPPSTSTSEDEELSNATPKEEKAFATVSKSNTEENQQPQNMDRIPVRPPQPIRFTGNVANEWERFLRDYEIFATACKLKNEDPEVQKAVFLSSAGTEATRIFTTLTVDSTEKYKLKAAKNAFAAEGEPFDTFLTDLRLLAKECNFDKLEDRLVRDRIVAGIHNSTLQANLLRKSNLTLKEAVDLCKANETSAAQVKVIAGDSERECLKMAANYSKRRNNINHRNPKYKEPNT
ncbi:hypothetical protein B4U80_06265, partial [Leptotrombidium deliense]